VISALARRVVKAFSSFVRAERPVLHSFSVGGSSIVPDLSAVPLLSVVRQFAASVLCHPVLSLAPGVFVVEASFS